MRLKGLTPALGAVVAAALVIAGAAPASVAARTPSGASAFAVRCSRAHHRCPVRRPRRCPERGGRTLVENHAARVWFTGSLTSESEGATLLGCLKAQARVRTLTQTNGCLHECDSFGMVVVRAPYVAWTYTASFSYGGDVPSTASETVNVYDLHRARRVSHLTVYTEQDDSTGQHISGGRLSRLLLASSGTAVLLVAQPGSTSSDLSLLPKGAQRATGIDSGPIDVRSVRLTHHLLTWSNGSAHRSRRVT